MNTLKFLAQAIAVQASEICNAADHVADHHSIVPHAVGPCQEELTHDVVKLAALLELAQLNGLTPRLDRDTVLRLRQEAITEVKRDLIEGMVYNRITGGIAFPLS